MYRGSNKAVSAILILLFISFQKPFSAWSKESGCKNRRTVVADSRLGIILDAHEGRVVLTSTSANSDYIVVNPDGSVLEIDAPGVNYSQSIAKIHGNLLVFIIFDLFRRPIGSGYVWDSLNGIFGDETNETYIRIGGQTGYPFANSISTRNGVIAISDGVGRMIDFCRINQGNVQCRYIPGIPNFSGRWEIGQITSNQVTVFASNSNRNSHDIIEVTPNSERVLLSDEGSVYSLLDSNDLFFLYEKQSSFDGATLGLGSALFPGFFRNLHSIPDRIFTSAYGRVSKSMTSQILYSVDYGTASPVRPFASNISQDLGNLRFEAGSDPTPDGDDFYFMDQSGNTPTLKAVTCK